MAREEELFTTRLIVSSTVNNVGFFACRSEP